MQNTVCFDGATSDAFPVSSGVKQGCVLAPTLFWIFFSMLLHYAFADCLEGVYIRTRPDGNLFNIARLSAITKTLKVLLHELLLADDVALASHTEAGLQRLSRLQGVRPYHQSKEDKHPSPRCRDTTRHYHHLLRVNSVKQGVARCRDQLKDRQGSRRYGQTQQECGSSC